MVGIAGGLAAMFAVVMSFIVYLVIFVVMVIVFGIGSAKVYGIKKTLIFLGQIVISILVLVAIWLIIVAIIKIPQIYWTYIFSK